MQRPLVDIIHIKISLGYRRYRTRAKLVTLGYELGIYDTELGIYYTQIVYAQFLPYVFSAVTNKQQGGIVKYKSV